MKYFVYIAFFLLVSCTKEIDVGKVNFEEKLVVHGHFSRDSFFKIHVQKTQAVIGTLDSQKLQNAVITLFEDGINIGQFSNDKDNYYRHLAQPDSGKNYEVQIQLGALKALSSSQLPKQMALVMVDTGTITGVKGSGYFQIQIKLNTTADSTFYELSSKLHTRTYIKSGSVVVDSVDEVKNVSLSSTDINLSKNSNNQNFDHHILFESHHLPTDGKLSFGTYDLKNMGKDTKPLSLTIECTSHTKDGYDYYNSLYNHFFYKNNPFALPVNVESNVANGHGVFSGVDRKSYQIAF